MGDDEHLRRAFKFFDKDQSGYIEFEELKEELFLDDVLDGTKSEQVIRDILFDADLDKVINRKSIILLTLLTYNACTPSDYSITVTPKNSCYIIEVFDENIIICM